MIVVSMLLMDVRKTLKKFFKKFETYLEKKKSLK